MAEIVAGPARPAPAVDADTSRRADGEVKSAARTLELLEVLAAEPRRLTLSELATRLGMPVSSTHQLLRTLVGRGWLAVTPDGAYGIGLRALVTGMAFLERDPLVQAVRPVLAALRTELGETIHFARLEGDRVFYLVSQESENQLRTVSRVGQSLPAHATALGKATLSTLSDAELRELLPAELGRLTPRTIVRLDDLIEDLRQTRARGYALEQEENLPGTACVSVPIPEVPGRYAISCSLPLFRLSQDRVDLVARTLEAGVRAIAATFVGSGR